MVSRAFARCGQEGEVSMIVPSTGADIRAESGEFRFVPDADWIPLVCNLALEEAHTPLDAEGLLPLSRLLLKCRISEAVTGLWNVPERERQGGWLLLQAVVAFKRGNADAAQSLLYHAEMQGQVAGIGRRLAERCRGLRQHGSRTDRVGEQRDLLLNSAVMGRVSGQLPAFLEAAENIERKRFSTALRLLEACRRAWKSYPDLTMLAQTGELVALLQIGRKDDAVEHMRRCDTNSEQVELVPSLFREISRSLRAYLRERLACRRALLDCYRHDEMLGRSAAFQRLLQKLRSAAASAVPVLLLGETGTGKELAARYLHRHSACKGELVSVNCAALPEQLFESELFGCARGGFTGAVEKEGLIARADDGTLLLDEFGALPSSVQAKLLRVLESGEYYRVGETRLRHVRLRVIAATSEADVLASERFRQDLIYRVSGHRIELPPLRDRPEDLELVVLDRLLEAGHDPNEHFLWTSRDLLLSHRWPGNFRELERCIQSLLEARVTELHRRFLHARGKETKVESQARFDLPLKTVLAQTEREVIQRALERCFGDKSRAASQLGVSVATLYAKLRRQGEF